MKTLVGLFAAGVLALSATAASASSAIGLVTVGNEFNAAQNTLGFEFSTLNAQSITALGIYDSGKDGLTGTSGVAVWDTFGTLIASGTVAAGTGGTLDGYFRYVSIAPVALTAGTHYVIGAYNAFDDMTSFGIPGGGTAALNLNLNYFGNRFNTAGGLSFADQSSGGGAFLGANFIIAPTVLTDDGGGRGVPEPATWALAILGFGMVGGVLRRRQAAFA